MAVGSTGRPASAGSRKHCALGIVQATAGLLGLLIIAFADRLAVFAVGGIAFLGLGATELVPVVIGRRRGAQ